MPRPFRYTIAGVPQHVVQRGNNRQPTFFGDDDRSFYRSCLLEAALRHGLAIHAYVLMSNHVHLLATPSEPNSIAQTLQSLGRRYVRHVNLLRDRSGTLWEGRHKASVIDTERYLATCHAYIELNPVRAGICADPADYCWSSCRHYVCDADDPLLTPPVTYTSLGGSPAERAASHRQQLLAGLDPDTLSLVRTHTARCAVLGDVSFRNRVEVDLGRRLPRASRGRPPKHLSAC